MLFAMPRAKTVEKRGPDGILRRYRVVETLEVVSHRCLVCGEWFEPTRADAKTCSSRCRTRLSRHGAKKSA